MSYKKFLAVSLMMSLASFAQASPVEMDVLPELKEKPLVFSAAPGEFVKRPSCKEVIFDLKGFKERASALVAPERQLAIQLNIRATQPQTRLVELTLHLDNGEIWGAMQLPLSEVSREVVIQADRLQYFRHFNVPKISAGTVPDLTRLTRVRFAFGNWLCRDAVQEPHGYEVTSVKLLSYVPYKPSAASRAAGYDISLDEFPRLEGETDDSERIKRAVVAAPSGSVLFFPRDVYKVSQTVFIPDGLSVLMHKSAVLTPTKEMPFVIEVTGTASDHNCFFIGGVIDGNGLASCMRLSGFAHYTMKDTTFLNGKESGLRVTTPSYELIATNLYFKTNIPGLAGNAGLDVRAGDSHYIDCVAVDCTIGFAIRGGGSNRLTRCHTWGGPLPPAKPGEDREMLKNSINFLIQGSSTILTDCYADTGKIGYKVDGWDTRMHGCSYFNNKAFKLDDITIVEHTKGRLLVTNGGFVKNTPNVTVYKGTGEVEWQNMMYSGFSPKDDCPGALTFKRKEATDQKALKLASEQD